MALHPDFPKSPYAIPQPDQRWFPAAADLRTTAYEKLLPPLVANICREVGDWRERGYPGASATSKTLLQWWFQADHRIEEADGTLSRFQYYFAQREAVETVIWLYDVRRAHDKFDLMRFDASGDGFELKFARFLDDAPDVVSFAKNYLAVSFKIDYVKADGDLPSYVPDFLVKTPDDTAWIVETKGRAEVDLPQKMTRLRQWCMDATEASRAEGGPVYRFVYVDQSGFERHPPTSFAALVADFTEYQA